MLLQDVIGEFLSLPPRALQLERVSEDIFCSVYLWTPTHSKATYGGQLVAHCVEAAYRAVDDPHTDIISLQLKFLSAGRSDCGSPVVYSVKSLHNGRSFFSRLVLAMQQERHILSAIITFSRQERGGLEHQLCLPGCPAQSELTGGSSSSLFYYMRSLTSSNEAREASRGESAVARVGYVNFMNPHFIQSTVPWELCLRVEPEGWTLLRDATGISEKRLNIIVACWLSDFVVALSTLFPHGFPNNDICQFASLDHTIYFHHPDRIRVGEWFLYEVFSPWAAQGRGIGQGRVYGQDGTLWMSTVQQTLMRTGKGYKSRL
ncbi:putative acyl-CoA thioesterase [Trypanosoma cruzi]|nr:putative acyl-CoA thioesterase [Trypanosoma cruzi]